MIRSGLTRLGRGEFGVQLDLDQHDEFGELGTFFNTVSAQLSADRSQMAGQVANLESAVEQLEDAVAIVNAARRAAVREPGDARAAAGRRARRVARRRWCRAIIRCGGCPSRRWSAGSRADRCRRAVRRASGERLVMTHAINDPKGDLVGIMLIARNLEYLSQVQSTVRYSRKLAALGRLSAGVAHEVKNPLNAMMIHLELLRQQFVRGRLARRARAAAGASARGAGRGRAPSRRRSTATRRSSTSTSSPARSAGSTRSCRDS